MSEFIIVTPADWVEFPNATYFIDNFTGEEGIVGVIERKEFPAMDALFVDNNLFTFEPGQGVNDMRMIRTGDPVNRFKLWLKLGPAM